LKALTAKTVGRLGGNKRRKKNKREKRDASWGNSKKILHAILVGGKGK